MKLSERRTKTNTLSKRQAAFVEFYVTQRQGAKSARLAGYSVKTARQMAAENLTKPAIQAAIALKEAEMAEKLDIDRNAIIGGIFSGIAQARECSDAGAILRGWLALGKITGLDKPDGAREPLLSHSGKATEVIFATLSDKELLAIAEGYATHSSTT